MFGKKARYCMAYEYGCLPPINGGREFLEQLWKRNWLWNKLVEVEAGHRTKVHALLANGEDEKQIESLMQKKQALQEEIKRKRAKARRGDIDVQDKREQIKEISAQIKELAVAAKERRKAKAEEARPLLDKLETERREAVKKACAESGLYWGNYDDVIHAYEVSRKRAMREGKELQFHRFDGQGKVSVRYQNGLPVEDVFQGKDGRLQIDPVNPDAWQHPVRAVRRKAARTVVRVRVASDENRKPVWLELPMVMHRPLPPGLIRQASVKREKLFDTYKYKLVVVVEMAQEPALKPHGKAVAIDIGWRKVEGGLRVAYWVDEEGEEGQIILDDGLLQQFAKLDDLKSICDMHFNDAKQAVIEWLAQKGDSVPEGLKEATANIDKWRGHGRLLKLLDNEQVRADEELTRVLSEFKKRRVHLKSWEAHLRDQLIKHRREMYRVFACSLAKEYNTVIFEDFDLRQVAKKPPPEDGTSGAKPQDYYRVVAAASVLRNVVIQTCRREGVNVVKLDPAYTTLRCHICDRIEIFDAAANLFHKCSCGAHWDIDRNACLNLLADFRRSQGISNRNVIFEEKLRDMAAGEQY